MMVAGAIREQHHHSLGSYGRPRMTQELKEIGLSVGHRRVGRLMRENGIRVVRTRKQGDDRQQSQVQHRTQLAG
jgi:putative transposase